jgi:hypothetical protein
MPDLIANLVWYVAGAFGAGFVFAWIACGKANRVPAGVAIATGATGAALALADADEDVQERRSAAGWLWRGYRAYDRGAGWWDRLAWFFGLFKSNAGVAVLVAATGGAATYGAVQLHEKVVVPHKLETAAIEVQPETRQMRNSTVFTIEGKDLAGRRGTFDVVVLNKSFLWVRGSAEDLEKDGATIPRGMLAGAAIDDEVRAALADAKEVIAVGTASQEGNAADEVARADRRAKRTAALVVDSDAVGRDVPISTLNLGQYRDPCTDCETGGTSWQRPFIIIAVKAMDEGTNVGEALADALTGKESLPSPKSYSDFALTRYR